MQQVYKFMGIFLTNVNIGRRDAIAYYLLLMPFDTQED
ncbi:hypothetical protein NIES21_36690 [Anabaenopsis circularis NIES-21]|uniref:Uncharacterized protein n=1 Tax=Anabaenopsis circularis NIES-21 TaxID=1085406 RepID=A0A1Z4GJZ7_9CYAN|nr:hypothetical protein NIES21_36690 [Anabaenopsis circularis NIES-21]